MTDSPLQRLAATPENDEWWLAEPLPKPADNYDESMGELSYSVLADNLAALNENLGEADTLLANATQYLVRLNDLEALVELSGRVADLKRGLAVAEAFIAREAGHLAADTEHREGFLADGRPFSVKRGANRKAWIHEHWQRDARLGILARFEVPAELINPESGEAVNVVALMAEAEAVHGSGAPRVTALKVLGLAADDYCQSHAGPYTVIITNPTTP